MTESDIQKLLEDLPNHANINDVYEVVSKRVDMIAMTQALNEGKLTFKDIAGNFAYIGFLEGVEFALRNLEAKPDNEEQEEGEDG